MFKTIREGLLNIFFFHCNSIFYTPQMTNYFGIEVFYITNGSCWYILKIASSKLGAINMFMNWETKRLNYFYPRFLYYEE